MPVVLLLPMVAIIGSFICFTLSQMIVNGQFQSAADGIPVIGHYLARGIDWMVSGLIRLANRYIVGNVAALVHWFVGLAQNVAGFVRSTAAAIGDLPDTLDHLLNVAVHDVVKAFVNPVRDRANDAYTKAVDAANDLSSLARSIPGQITGRIDTATDTILDRARSGYNAADRALERELTGYADAVAGEAERVARGIGADVTALERQLGELLDPRTLAELLAGVGGLAAVTALVETQVMPLVRDLTECSPKLRATCQLDMSEWLGLLEGLVLAAGIPSLYELAKLTQDYAPDFFGDVLDYAGVTSGSAKVPAHPGGW